MFEVENEEISGVDLEIESVPTADCRKFNLDFRSHVLLCKLESTNL